MRASIKREFGKHRPRAFVLDDNANARSATARRLKRKSFDVVECKNVEAFRDAWAPGAADVIISDWDLSHDKDEKGDWVLEFVRKSDWDVPFVLISGRLKEADPRAGVLERVLQSGGAGFVTRGEKGIERACDLAEDLIERRDLSLLKMILALREGATAGKSISTSSGTVQVRKILSDLVASPKESHNALRPVSTAHGKKVTKTQ